MLSRLRSRLPALSSQVTKLTAAAAGSLIDSRASSTVLGGPSALLQPSTFSSEGSVAKGCKGFCSAAEPPLPPSDPRELYCALPELNADERQLLENLASGIKEGRVQYGDVVQGLVDGNLTRQDLNYLLSKGAIDEFQYKELITDAIGGTPKLCFKEICQLVKDRHVGKDDIMWMLQEGMIVPGDITYMVEKEHLPQEIGDLILSEFQPLTESDGTGFSDILARVRSGKLALESLEALVINGQLPAEDVDLLVKEGAVREDDAEKLLEDSAEEVNEAYSQATAFSMLVNDNKVSFEELQMMRVKGVLGNSVIHFLVNEKSITNEQGKDLLGIEEDPEVNTEGIEGIDRGSPDYEALPGNNILHKPNGFPAETEDHSGLNPYDPQAPIGPATEGAGAALDGFYPSHIDKDDIIGLFEHLEETYKDIPGLPPVEEILQEAADEEKEEKKQKRLAEEAKQALDREKIVDNKGRAYATGKRKCAVARVWISEGPGEMQINKMGVHEYFQNIDSRVHVTAPFIATNTLGQFNLMATVKGGGLSAQAQAVRHGVSKALQNFDPSHRPTLKACGLLTRDAREVERKKPGRAKARKSFAWVKR